MTFDPGLQPERTALAWRRTVLALVTGVIVSVRLAAHSAGVAAYLLSFVAIAFGAATIALVHRRYSTSTRTLADHSSGILPDGLLPAAVAATTFALGLCAGAALLLS
nr:DUF202 domain-containing protein [Rhodococcus sp. (in: high G+C Gram-positive bacteria)]